MPTYKPCQQCSGLSRVRAIFLSAEGWVWIEVEGVYVVLGRLGDDGWCQLLGVLVHG